MTIPPPQHSEAMAASLDGLREALDLALDHPERAERIIVATQAVYAAGLNALLGTVSTMLTDMAYQVAHIQRMLDLRPEQQLHDLRNQIQRMMESTILMRENTERIGLLESRVEQLERVVGEQESLL